jgi:hypothetical protein
VLYTQKGFRIMRFTSAESADRVAMAPMAVRHSLWEGTARSALCDGGHLFSHLQPLKVGSPWRDRSEGAPQVSHLMMYLSALQISFSSLIP